MSRDLHFGIRGDVESAATAGDVAFHLLVFRRVLLRTDFAPKQGVLHGT